MYKAARRAHCISRLRAHFNDFGVFSFCVVAQTKPTNAPGANTHSSSSSRV